MDFDEQIPRRPRQLRSAAKTLVIVLAAGVFFGAGVAVGRGDINVDGLSQDRRLPAGSAFDYSSVDQLFGVLQKDFDGSLDKNQLLDGIKSGLVEATGDPFTEYFNPKEAKEFNDALSGSFTGIGAELGTDEDDNIVIVSPLSGYPAAKAGLKPKDIVAAVDGKPTSGMRVDAVVRKIRGPANTDVKLTIVRGAGRPFEVTITRTQIKIASVEHSVDGSIGYLKISQFSEDTVDLTKDAAKDFKAKGVKGVVLDLRGNPGGFLDGAVDIAGMWLNKGKTIVSERRGSTTLSTKRSSGSDEFKGLPTVVLIDGGSASAAEIIAGALHDNRLATLVGVQSFGKGSVQQVVNLPDGSELKVTIARWYTPAGENIDKQGIEPDVKIEISEADTDAGRDPQKDKAYEILRSKI
ncbi:S41 family peptidase [Candidatus Saccharibacteria bacterium]|nr:S41 family peptidase [Candidatus Saccharibacteria bacterium]